jgi:hypothetical protein
MPPRMGIGRRISGKPRFCRGSGVGAICRAGSSGGNPVCRLASGPGRTAGARGSNERGAGATTGEARKGCRRPAARIGQRRALRRVQHSPGGGRLGAGLAAGGAGFGYRPATHGCRHTCATDGGRPGTHPRFVPGICPGAGSIRQAHRALSSHPAQPRITGR